jgi:hypothetical protein
VQGCTENRVCKLLNLCGKHDGIGSLMLVFGKHLFVDSLLSFFMTSNDCARNLNSEFFASNRPYQDSFNPNCTLRPSFAAAITPTLPLAMLLSGFAKFAWLSRLKNSPRT